MALIFQNNVPKLANSIKGASANNMDTVNSVAATPHSTVAAKKHKRISVIVSFLGDLFQLLDPTNVRHLTAESLFC